MAENNENTTNQGEKENEAFSSMLNAAQKKLGITPEQQADGAENATAPAENADGDQSESGEKKSKLTQAQIEALLGDDETSAEAAPANGETAPAEAGAEGGEAKPEGEGENPEDYDDTEEIAAILGKRIGADDEDEKPASPSEPEKPKKSMLGFIVTVAAVVVALALGFCISMLMFSDVIKSDSENFAIRAANAVNSKLPVNSELYILRSYVKHGAGDTECMLYYATCYGTETTVDMCRVTVTKDKPNTVNIYYTLDESSPDYIAMKQSEDAEVRLQASFLKNYSDAVYAADKLIQINSPQWEKIDCTKINRNITSKQDSNAAPAQTTAATQKPADDIDDINDIED